MGLNILAVIPARGGSKGIPKKNIYPLHGKPLIAYTLEAASNCEPSFDIAVSTDSEEIQSVVEHYNNVTIVRRPAELAEDNSPTEATLLHTLDYVSEKRKSMYDCVLTLQPTSPLRSTKTIESFIAEFEKVIGTYDSQISLTADYGDYWTKNDTSDFQRLFPAAPRRRQDRSPLYIENSALYITTVKILRRTKSVLGTRCTGFVMDPIESLDINFMHDMLYAEFLLSQANINSLR